MNAREKWRLGEGGSGEQTNEQGFGEHSTRSWAVVGSGTRSS